METIIVAGQLEKFATSDLRRACKEAYMLVGATKLGTLAISYAPVSRTYTIRKFASGELVVQGKLGTVRPILAGLYVCVSE